MSDIYSRGGEDIETEQLAGAKRSSRRCREEQRRIYELFISGHYNPALARPGGNGCSPGRQSATTPRRHARSISCGPFVVIRATAPCTAVSARP